MLIVVLALAAGCELTFPWTDMGGGADDGGGGGGEEAGILTVTPGSLQVSAVDGGQAPAPRRLTLAIELTRTTPQTEVYVDWTYQGAVVSGLEYVGDMQLSVEFPLPGALGAARTGAVTVAACFDPGCNRHLQGSPFTVPVSYTVERTLIATPGVLNAEWTRGAPVPSLHEVALALPETTGATASAAITYGDGSGWLSATAAPIPGSSTVSLAPEGLAAGQHSALVTYSSTTGKTAGVVVNLLVKEPPVTADPAALSFAGVVGQPPPEAQTAALSNGGVAATYLVTVDTGGTGTWLVAPATVSSPGPLSLRPGTTALAAGTYHATVTLEAADGTSCGSLAVTYEVVESGLADPQDRLVTVTAATTTAELAGTTAIDASAGPPLAFTASSDAAWLVLDAAGGTTGESLAWHVDPGVLATMRHGDERVATVTVAATELPVTTSFTLTLQDRLPEVQWVAPSVQPADRPARVRVRGVGFSGLELVGLEPVEGISGVAVSRVNDTSLVLDVPAAEAGARMVSVPNALGVATRSASLHHAAHLPTTFQKVAQVGPKKAAILDARRNAVFTVNAAQGAVVRFGEAGGTWSPVVRVIAGVQDLGLSPDGEVLVAVTTNEVRLLDPVTLADVETFTPPGTPSYWPMSESDGLAVLNDGRVMMPGQTGRPNGLTAFDLDTHTFGDLPVAPDVGFLGLYGGPWHAASRDGERLLVVQSTSITPTPPVLFLDASEGTARRVPDGFGFFYHASLSDDGGRVAVDSYAAWDGGFVRVGEMGTWGGPGAAMSPDGTHAYVLQYAADYATAPVPASIHVLDTTTVPASGVELPVLRSFDVAGHVSCTTGEYGCQYRVHVIPSPDDTTLYIVGQQGLLVVPIPPP